MKRRTMRCVFIALALILAFSMVFTACGKSAGTANEQSKPEASTAGDAAAEKPADSQPAEEKGANLRFMIWDAAQKDAYVASLQEFNKEHPNIKVSVEVNGWNQYWQKIQTEMAGGSAPDVFWNQIQYFPTFITKDTILDLKPFIDRDNIDLSNYDENLTKIYSKDGKVYGIPKDWDTIALFYNKDAFDKAGVAYPDGNLTWDAQTGGTFLELAKKMTLDKNGKNAAEGGFDPKSIQQYGFASYNSDQPFYWNFMLMNGGGFQKEPWGSEFLYDQPETVETMQFLADLTYKHYVSPEGTQIQTAGADQLFYSGKISMITNGSWMLKSYKENCKFTYGVALLPKGPQGRISIVNGLAESIYTKSKNIDQAWEVIKWFAGQKNQSIFAETGTTFPAFKSEIPKFIESWKAKGVDVSPFVTELNERTNLSAESLSWNEINASVQKNYSLLFLNKLDAKTAGDNIMKDIKNILEASK